VYGQHFDYIGITTWSYNRPDQAELESSPVTLGNPSRILTDIVSLTRRRHIQGVQGLAGVLPVPLGAADLRWAKLRAGRAQAGAQHGPAALLVQPLAVLRPRAVPGVHSASGARGRRSCLANSPVVPRNLLIARESVSWVLQQAHV
jgi:hypothetical protein